MAYLLFRILLKNLFYKSTSGVKRRHPLCPFVSVNCGFAAIVVFVFIYLAGRILENG